MKFNLNHDPNNTSAVYTAQAAVNTTRTIAAAIK